MNEQTPHQEERGIVWFVLDEASHNTLKNRFPGDYDQYFGHHCTLAFGVSRAPYAALIGQKATIQAYAHAKSGSAEAVRVQTDGLPDTYGVPHITISTPTGVPPFASVAMLQNQHQEVPIEPTLTLSGTIEYAPLDGRAM